MSAYLFRDQRQNKLYKLLLILREKQVAMRLCGLLIWARVVALLVYQWHSNSVQMLRTCGSPMRRLMPSMLLVQTWLVSVVQQQTCALRMAVGGMRYRKTLLDTSILQSATLHILREQIAKLRQTFICMSHIPLCMRATTGSQICAQLLKVLHHG